MTHPRAPPPRQGSALDSTGHRAHEHVEHSNASLPVSHASTPPESPPASAPASPDPIAALIRFFVGDGTADNPNAGILYGNGYSFTGQSTRMLAGDRRMRLLQMRKNL